MRLPGWYRRGSLVWLFAAPAFWLFMTAFNGLPFFSLPQLAGPSEGEGWQKSLVIQFAIYATLLFPLTALPLAAAQARSSDGHKDN